MTEQIKTILDSYPFLSYAEFGTDVYIGIVLNTDASLTSMYILDLIPDERFRAAFLELGNEWWWGSNRQIPINVFFQNYFDYYNCCLRHFNTKEFKVIHGHTISLQTALDKRIRKKSITLKKK